MIFHYDRATHQDHFCLTHCFVSIDIESSSRHTDIKTGSFHYKWFFSILLYINENLAVYIDFTGFTLKHTRIYDLSTSVYIQRSPVSQYQPRCFPFRNNQLVILRLLRFTFHLLLIDRSLSFLRITDTGAFIHFYPLLCMSDKKHLLHRISRTLFQ